MTGWRHPQAGNCPCKLRALAWPTEEVPYFAGVILNGMMILNSVMISCLTGVVPASASVLSAERKGVGPLCWVAQRGQLHVGGTADDRVTTHRVQPGADCGSQSRDRSVAGSEQEFCRFGATRESVVQCPSNEVLP
jgi:hypothetical protein